MGYAQTSQLVLAWQTTTTQLWEVASQALLITPMWRFHGPVALAKLPNEEFPEPEINTDGLKPVLRGEYIDTAALLEAMQSKQAAGRNK